MSKYDWSNVGQDEQNIASSRLAGEVRAQIGAAAFSLPAARDAALAELLARSTEAVFVGGTGDGVADDTAAVQAALDVASEGATVVFPPGRYLVTSLSITGRSVFLYGPGATLVQASDAAILTYRGGWGTIYDITGFAQTTYDFSNGAGVSTEVTRLDFASAPALVAGAVVRVVSDDQLAGATTATRRRGEFALVGAVDGTSVYLTGRLLDTYTTAPRVARLENYSFGMEGLTFDSLMSGAWTNALVLITAARDVSIRHVRVLSGGGTGIKLTGVHGFSVHDYRASDLANSPSASQFGYGLQLSAAELGSVSHCMFTNCRHGFTTDASTVDAGSALIERFGRVRHVFVDHSHARGCSNSGFDCHNDAYDVTFDHCTDTAEVRGEDSTGAPFQVRGKKIRLVHCQGRGRYGVAIYDDGGGATDDVVLHHCDLQGTVAAVLSDSLGSGTGVTNLVIEGGIYRSSGFYGLQLTDCRSVTLRGAVKFILTGTSANTRFAELTNSIIYIDHVTVDLTGATAAQMYGFRFLDATSYVIGERLRVEVYPADLETFARGASAGNGSLTLTDIVFWGALPTTFSANLLAAYYSWKSEGIGTPAATAVRAQDLSADNVDLDIAGIFDDVIYIRVAALVSDRLLGVIPVNRPGQQLFIRSFSAGGFTTTVQNGVAYNTDMNADKVLANGDVLHLISTTAASQKWVLLNVFDRP